MKERKVTYIDVGKLSLKDAYNAIDPTGKMWKDRQFESLVLKIGVVLFLISIGVQIIYLIVQK